MFQTPSIKIVIMYEGVLKSKSVWLISNAKAIHFKLKKINCYCLPETNI